MQHVWRRGHEHTKFWWENLREREHLENPDVDRRIIRGLESKYRFAVKNRIRFRLNFYCYRILHSSNYFSTYSSPLLRHLS